MLIIHLMGDQAPPKTINGLNHLTILILVLPPPLSLSQIQWMPPPSPPQMEPRSRLDRR